jgi:hypothetical protein
MSCVQIEVRDKTDRFGDINDPDLKRELARVKLN